MQNEKRKTENHSVKLKTIPRNAGYRHFAFCDLHFAFQQGFTLVEAVVMIAVVTFMSALVLVSFTGLNEGGVLNRAARELALTLRSAQNMALAVRAVPTEAGPVTAPAVGVQLQAGQTFTQTFADMEAVGQNGKNKYTPLTPEQGEEAGLDLDIQKGYLPRGVMVNRLHGKNPSDTYPKAHVIFTAPEAALTLTDQDGTRITDGELHIIVAPSDGTPTREIVVKTNGQISIK